MQIRRRSTWLKEEVRIFVWLLLDSDSIEDLDFPLRGELLSELNWIGVLYNLCIQVTIPM